MVGCLITVFVKRELKNRVKDIQTSKVKTGFRGQMGNKGAVLVR